MEAWGVEPRTGSTQAPDLAAQSQLAGHGIHVDPTPKGDGRVLRPPGGGDVSSADEISIESGKRGENRASAALDFAAHQVITLKY